MILCLIITENLTLGYCIRLLYSSVQQSHVTVCIYLVAQWHSELFWWVIVQIPYDSEVKIIWYNILLGIIVQGVPVLEETVQFPHNLLLNGDMYLPSFVLLPKMTRFTNGLPQARKFPFDMVRFKLYYVWRSWPLHYR